MIVAKFLLALLITGIVFCIVGAILNPLFGLGVAAPIALAAWFVVAYKFNKSVLAGRRDWRLRHWRCWPICGR